MSYLPCKNPNCNSYGQPHPNCKCYGEFAAGGDAAFCSSARAHNPGCEYFAEGGDTLPEGFTVDEPADDEVLPEGFTVDEPGDDERLPEGFTVDGETTAEPPQDQSGLEKVVAGVQGAATGALGPLGPLAVGALGPGFGWPASTAGLSSLDEQKRLKQENPEAYEIGKDIGFVASMATGVGEAALLERAALAATGSKVLQRALQGGLFGASNEVTKWILGDDPDSATGAVTAIGASAVLGPLLGAAADKVGSAGSNTLKKIAETKFGQRATSFLHGLALGSYGLEKETLNGAVQDVVGKGSDLKAVKKGIEFYGKLVPALGGAVAGAAYGAANDEDLLDVVKDGFQGALYGDLGARVGGRVAGKVARPVVGKWVAPALLKILSSGTYANTENVIRRAAEFSRGNDLINKSVDHVFRLTPAVGAEAVTAYGGDKLIKDLKTFLGEGGGITQNLQEQVYQDAEVPQGFAHGGEVKSVITPTPAVPAITQVDKGVADHYPAHNMLMSTARGRISQYLNGLRPLPNAPKLPFDDEPDTRQQKKAYERALHIAAAPLSIMRDVKKGTVQPEDVKHLTSMYPELTTLLQKRITERVVKDQLDGKKPPYRVRQGLSLLLGAPLSGEMTPQAIQAAQSVFARTQHQAQGSPSPAGAHPPPAAKTNKLSKADQAYLTGNQSLVKRSQKA